MIQGGRREPVLTRLCRLNQADVDKLPEVRIPPVPIGLERAAGWAWRLIACAIALAGVVASLALIRREELAATPAGEAVPVAA